MNNPLFGHQVCRAGRPKGFSRLPAAVGRAVDWKGRFIMMKSNPDQLKRCLWFLSILLLLAAAPACLGMATAKPVKPAIEENVAERAPDSLAIDVVDFDWTYFNDGYHLKLSGTVRNNTGAPIQAVTLGCTLYDEVGRPVGRGESYLSPTYLPDGSEGSFEITIMPSRTKGIQHIRLVTRASVWK